MTDNGWWQTMRNDRQWRMMEMGNDRHITGNDRQLINKVKDNAEWQTIGNDRQLCNDR